LASRRCSRTALTGAARPPPARPALRPSAAAATDGAAAKPDPFATREVYSDSDLLSKIMIRYFSGVMSRQLGDKPYDGTYDGFVELSKEVRSVAALAVR
jgi:hypothetical protein